LYPTNPHLTCNYPTASLSLPNILQRNKKIEAENDARSTKTLNNALDPTAHPQTGSEATSLITIDAEDLV